MPPPSAQDMRINDTYGRTTSKHAEISGTRFILQKEPNWRYYYHSPRSNNSQSIPAHIPSQTFSSFFFDFERCKGERHHPPSPTVNFHSIRQEIPQHEESVDGNPPKVKYYSYASFFYWLPRGLYLWNKGIRLVKMRLACRFWRINLHKWRQLIRWKRSRQQWGKIRVA